MNTQKKRELQSWLKQMEKLRDFREKNKRLPNYNMEEKQLSMWYKKQLSYYHLKIYSMKDFKQYDEFTNFLQTYGYGKVKENTSVNINGKKVQKSSIIIIDYEDIKANIKNITIKTFNEEKMQEFLILLNEALIEDNRTPINIQRIGYRHNNGCSANICDGIDWRDMPSYNINDNVTKIISIKIILSKEKSKSFRNCLMGKINQIITQRTSSIWYPEKLVQNSIKQLYVEEGEKESIKITTNIPKYPIYVISYKRWEKKHLLTSNYLEWSNIPYYIVIRPEEYEAYVSTIDPKKILVLTEGYLETDQGSVPARNFCWFHSRSNGDKRHWILDDNINGYYRLNHGKRYKIKSASVFRIIEDYVDRYENVKMAGHNYKCFVVPIKPIPQIYFNTRIYSSILLSNDEDFANAFPWRGKYNEDTDLSLRILKAGYPTILFNVISADKVKTLTMKGGNAEIYEGEGVYLKAKSLADQHPDVVKIGTRFSRVHHIVNYKSFKDNVLIPAPNVKIREGSNDYYLILVPHDNKNDEECDEDMDENDGNCDKDMDKNEEKGE